MYVGGIGQTGTMRMNVLEATREIGVMRAIGAVDFEIMKSVVIVLSIIASLLPARNAARLTISEVLA